MPAIKSKSVNDTEKPNLQLKPNHYKYTIIPRRIWYSSKEGTALKSGDWYISRKRNVK